MTEPKSPAASLTTADPNLQETLAAVTPQVYQSFRRAIALRKWPDGRALTEVQLQTCLQAVIAYEHHCLPPEQRTGYVPPKEDACAHENAVPEETPLQWRE